MSYRSAAAVFALALMSGAAAARTCDESPTPPTPADPLIDLSFSQELRLGAFARPDTGVTQLSLSATSGARSGTNLLAASPFTTPQRAVGVITGGANCDFTITFGALPAGYVALELQGDTGPLSSTGSGATGQLDGTGQFQFFIGATVDVNAATADTYTGSVDFTVSY